MDILTFIDKVNQNFDKQPEPRYNTKKYFTDNVDDIGPGPNNRNKIPRLNVMPEIYNSEEQGSGVMINPRGLQDGKLQIPTQGLNEGGIATPKRGFVDGPGSYAGNIPKGYINLTELGEIVGLPERIATHPKTGKKRALGGLRQRILDTLARKPSKERRNLKSKDFAEKFLIKELDLKQIDLGQGRQTFIIKKPKKTELKKLKEYYLRKGSKYGVTKETVGNMKTFYTDKDMKKYIRKGKIVPRELILAKGFTENQAANITLRLAQSFKGKKFENIETGIPVNKKISKKLMSEMEKAPFGNPYSNAVYNEAMDIVTTEVGPKYFDKPFKDMKREARRLLNEAGISVFDPTIKGSTGVNVNELIGMRNASRTGTAEYAPFVNLMEGKLNTGEHAKFVAKFEEFNNELQTADNKNKVIKEYNEYRKNFVKNTKGRKDSDLPKLSVKKPEVVYGKKRNKKLLDLGLDLDKSYNKLGYTIDVGKKTPTIKEMINKIKDTVDAVEDLPEGKKILICNRLSNGGLPGDCANAIKKDFMKTSQIIVEETKDLKTAAGAKALKAGRTLLKFGVVGEGAFIGVDAGIRAYMGRPKNEAFLAATFREGKADDLRKKRAGLTDREFLVDKATNLKNKISSLQQQITAAERTGNDVMIPSFEKRLKETMAEIEKPFDKIGTRLVDLLDPGSATNISYQRKMENIMDSDRAKSTLAKQTKDDVDMGIPNISDEIEVDAGVSKKTFAPRKTFGNFRNTMLMREPDIRAGINDLYKKGTFGEPGLELTKEKAIKGYETYLKYYKDQQNAPLSQLAEEFGAEQVYGTQGKFASGGMARVGYGIGGVAKVYQLLRGVNKTKPLKGLEEKLIKQYKSEGMEFIKAIEKAQTKAAGIRYENKMKIIDDAMKDTNVYSDDYVDLLDMKIKLEDPDFAKDYMNFSETLKNKTRARTDEGWAEANFGENYSEQMDIARSKEINESIDPNFKEPLSPSDQMASDIDDMNKANIDEIIGGRKKNATGGLANLTRTTPPKRGPQSQGLASFMKNGKR